MLKIFISLLLIVSFGNSKNLSRNQIKNIIMHSSKFKKSKNTPVKRSKRTKTKTKKTIKISKKVLIKPTIQNHSKNVKISKGIPYQLFASSGVENDGKRTTFKKGFTLIRGEKKQTIDNSKKTQEDLLNNLL